MLRVIFGPLPTWICFLNLLLKGTFAHSFPLILSGVFVFKYLFTCIWRRMRNLEDDLIAFSILIISVTLAFFLQLFKMLGPTKPTNFTVSIILKIFKIRLIII